jgi:hypothetical protein
MWHPLRTTIQRLGESEPLLLAHHPTCDYYDHHTFDLYGQEVCMGCFVVYPVGVATLATLVATRLAVPSLPLFGLDALAFWLAGFALATPMLADKALPGRRSGRTRMVAKAVLAVGLALLSFPAVFRPAVRLQTAALFVGFLVPYVAYKGLTVREDCAGCPEYDDFPDCSGMRFDDAYRWDTDDPPTASRPHGQGLVADDRPDGQPLPGDAEGHQRPGAADARGVGDRGGAGPTDPNRPDR